MKLTDLECAAIRAVGEVNIWLKRNDVGGCSVKVSAPSVPDLFFNGATSSSDPEAALSFALGNFAQSIVERGAGNR